MHHQSRTFALAARTSNFSRFCAFFARSGGPGADFSRHNYRVLRLGTTSLSSDNALFRPALGSLFQGTLTLSTLELEEVVVER